MPESPSPKLRNACNECHAAKVKCSGERTGCNRCVNAQQACTYSISMVGKVQNHRKRQARRGINREAFPVSPANTEVEQQAGRPKTTSSDDTFSTQPESGTELGQTAEVGDHLNFNQDQQSNAADGGNPNILNEETPVHQSGPDLFWSLTPDYLSDEGMIFSGALSNNPSFEERFTSDFDDQYGPRSRTMTPSNQQSPLPPPEYMHHSRSMPEHRMALSEDAYRRGHPSRIENPIEAYQNSRPQSTHGSVRNSGTFNHPTQRRPPPDRHVAASRCLVAITKLQRLAREATSVTVDILLATNKNALLELSSILNQEMRASEACNQFSDYSQNKNGFGNEGLEVNPVGLMIYVIALQYITDLYTQACSLFLMQWRYGPASSSRSGNSRSGVHAGLPQLDFGSFKIDITDQRRLFAEIIGRELATALGVCQKVRDSMLNQPGDISAPSGMLEETFLGIEVQLRNLIEQVKS